MGASSADFNHIGLVKGGIRCQDRAARSRAGQIFQVGAFDGGGDVFLRAKGCNGSIRLIIDTVKCRHIGTRYVARDGYQGCMFAVPGFKNLYKTGQNDFGFTDQEAIKKRGNRFRIYKTGHPAGKQQGIVTTSVLGP